MGNELQVMKLNIAICDDEKAIRALMMTAADDLFWTFNQAVSYYDFAIVNYRGFRDKGRLLAGGCGDSNGSPAIGRIGHLEDAYQFGKNIYYGEQ